VLPPIVVNGVHYRVLWLEGEAGGMRFLLRNDAGELFGVYGRNALNPALGRAARAEVHGRQPFRGVDFFDTTEGRLAVRLTPHRGACRSRTTNRTLVQGSPYSAHL
jgi:hypothetical protein